VAEAVRIDYHVGQHGWSRFQLTVGTTSVVVGPFSYVTDALGDLVRVGSEPDGMPIAPQQLAHRCAAGHRGQFGPGGGRPQGIGGAEIAIPLGDGLERLLPRDV
jgi:hypothetical protein